MAGGVGGIQGNRVLTVKAEYILPDGDLSEFRYRFRIWSEVEIPVISAIVCWRNIRANGWCIVAVLCISF
tara:strand:+ start:404 stop:613 length:210 start_codon:yes stop_codon:yes gene_type:complete